MSSRIRPSRRSRSERRCPTLHADVHRRRSRHPRQTLVGPSVSKMSYAVRTATPPANLVAAVRSALGEIDPNLALFDVRSLETSSIVPRHRWRSR